MLKANLGAELGGGFIAGLEGQYVSTRLTGDGGRRVPDYAIANLNLRYLRRPARRGSSPWAWPTCSTSASTSLPPATRPSPVRVGRYRSWGRTAMLTARLVSEAGRANSVNQIDFPPI